MTGFETYCLYRALCQHFDIASDYDFFRSGGKVDIDQSEFDTSRYRLIFTKLARKYSEPSQIVSLFVSNIMLGKSKQPPAYFLSSGAIQSANVWQKNISRIIDIVYKECLVIRSSTDDIKIVMEPLGGGHPLLLSLFYADEISLETLIVFDRLFNFRKKWGNGIVDDILWPETEKIMLRYSPFLVFDNDEMRHAIKNAFKSKE